jgi:hypothetical protein
MTHPDHTRAFHAGRRREQARIRFLEHERGREPAADFARRTLGGYRRAVLRRTPPAGEPVLRYRLMGSYCYFKRYLDAVQRDEAAPAH